LLDEILLLIDDPYLFLQGINFLLEDLDLDLIMVESLKDLGLNRGRGLQ
jgi:hypothetical protein